MSSVDCTENQIIAGKEHKPAPARKWLYALGFLLSLICLYYFAQRTIAMRGELELLSGDALQRIFVATPFFFLSYLLASSVWHYLLNLLGAEVRLRTATSIFLVTQFGKYLPGNVGQHVGRVTVAKRYGIPMFPVLASMLMEMILVLSIMVFLSLPVIVQYIDTVLYWSVSGLIMIGLAGLGICIGSTRLREKIDHAIKRLCLPNIGWHFVIPIFLALASICMSGSAMLSLHPGFMARLDIGAYVVSVFCAAWVAGFVTPGAPAGLGIRELILSGGLSPVVGIEGATTVAILLRAVTTLTDLLAFVIGLLLLPRARS